MADDRRRAQGLAPPWTEPDPRETLPCAGNIPLLRLDALDTTGRGIFSDVTFSHRLATEGGVGPSGGDATPAARIEVPYASDDDFYVSS
jgi:hypothetical protein